MRKTVGILGLGVFGMTIAKQLSDYDCDIIAVDRDEINVNRIESLVTKAVIAEVISLDGNISLVEFYPPKSWVGKQLRDLDLRKDYDLNLIGYREGKDESLNTKVFADFLIREDVILVAIIGTDSLDKATFLED